MEKFKRKIPRDAVSNHGPLRSTFYKVGAIPSELARPGFHRINFYFNIMLTYKQELITNNISSTISVYKQRTEGCDREKYCLGPIQKCLGSLSGKIKSQ